MLLVVVMAEVMTPTTQIHMANTTPEILNPGGLKEFQRPEFESKAED